MRGVRGCGSVGNGGGLGGGARGGTEEMSEPPPHMQQMSTGSEPGHLSSAHLVGLVLKNEQSCSPWSLHRFWPRMTRNCWPSGSSSRQLGDRGGDGGVSGGGAGGGDGARSPPPHTQHASIGEIDVQVNVVHLSSAGCSANQLHVVTWP